MSVEAAVIALLIEDGTPKRAYQKGIGTEDFELYDEEFQWVEKRAQSQKPINPRIFREKFPDFEWIVPSEDISDLLDELKQERSFSQLKAAIETVDSDLSVENAVEKATELREYVTDILRANSPVHDVDLGAGFKDSIKRMKQLRVLRENGEVAGIPTGYKWIDHEWGGLIPGRVVTVLGRTGDAKSYFIASMAAAGWKAGYKIGIFSPEMNRFEHECRMDTLLSADPAIQERCGLRQAFRNRALMEGVGFPLKKWERFKQFQDTMRGRCILFTQEYRRQKMTASYIDSKVEDLGLDMVIVDPIYKLQGPRKRENRVWELADIIDEIEDMAKGHNIPVVVSNQAFRQRGVAAARRAPSKDMSYMSDAIAHESDHVIGVKFESDDKILRLRCSKSRFGGEFDIDVKFHPNIGLIKETTEPKGSWTNGDGAETNPGSDLPSVQPKFGAASD